jgi:hypothetical protein
MTDNPFIEFMRKGAEDRAGEGMASKRYDAPANPLPTIDTDNLAIRVAAIEQALRGAQKVMIQQSKEIVALKQKLSENQQK